MGRRKDLSTEEVVERVISASRKLFVTKGYFNTSIPDIVKESGISIGAIYHHFENKQNLAKYLYDETMEVFLKRLSAALDKAVTLRDKLTALVQLLFTMTEEDPVMMEYMLFVKHSEIYEDAQPICMSKPFQLIQDLLEEGIDQGVIRAGRREVMAASFVGTALKVVEMKIRGVITESLAELVDETVVNSWNAVVR